MSLSEPRGHETAHNQYDEPFKGRLKCMYLTLYKCTVTHIIYDLYMIVDESIMESMHVHAGRWPVETDS